MYLKNEVLDACTIYSKILCEIVYDCYIRFRPLIDAKERYTVEYFRSLGKTIEDAEEEFGFPRGWTAIGDPSAISYRWQSLRDQESGWEINHIFDKYIGRVIPFPERLPSYGR